MNQPIDARMAQAVALVRNARRVLLCTHLTPDGDAIGSLLALDSAIRRMGKQTLMICHDLPPRNLRFLPGVEGIQLPEAARGQSFDLGFSIDASDAERLGDSAEAFFACAQTLQMDHHQTNAGFAQHNVVDALAPASGTLAYRFIQATGLPFEQHEAICLYAAISTDTGNFCFSHINAETFEQMAGLMNAGLPIVETARQLHLMREKEHVLLLGRALHSLQFDLDGQLSFMVIRQEDMEATHATQEHADRIVNYGLYIPGVRMCYLATQTDGGVKFSLRAIAPDEVASIALELGGGGHPQAAGCTLSGPMEEAVARVHQRLRQALRA